VTIGRVPYSDKRLINLAFQRGRPLPARQADACQATVMAASQLLVRFDQGSTDAIARETEQALINELTSCFAACDAVIVSDYGYGILTAG